MYKKIKNVSEFTKNIMRCSVIHSEMVYKALYVARDELL